MMIKAMTVTEGITTAKTIVRVLLLLYDYVFVSGWSVVYSFEFWS